MKYSDTKTLYPNEEKSVGFDKESLEQLKNINERLDNMSNDIADLNNEVDGLDNQVVTENLQAAQASLQEASVNELSAQSASIPELEAGNATANKVTSRGEIKGAQLEITGTSHLKDDVTVDGKVTSESVRAGSVTTDHLIADEMDVTDFTVDELSVTEKATIKEEEVETSVITTQTVSSQTVESQEVTSQNVVSQDVTSQEVTNQDVENAVIEDAEIKALTSGGNTFNFNSDNSIAITEDSYIRIKPEINSEIRLILKTALNATILAAAVSVDVPAADKANIHLVYSNTEALSDIYFDVDGNLWLKLESGVRGTLYFMQGGINAITPETDSVVNPAFDPTAEGTVHYESGTHGDIYITSKVIFHSEVQIDENADFKKDVEVGGDVHIEGNLDVDGILSIGSLSAERAEYLGDSDNVTADEEGNFSAKAGTFDGDVTATGDVKATGDLEGADIHATNDLAVDGAASVGGTLNVTDDITTLGDIEGKNLTTSHNANIGGDATVNGDVTVDGNLNVNGSITGDVTGDVTGNVTGDVNGDVSGNAGSADKWKTARLIKIQDADGTNVGTGVNIDGSADKTLKLPSKIKANLTGNVNGNVTGDVTGNVTGDVTGNLSGTADKATKDGQGNVIDTTYAKASEVNTEIRTQVLKRGYTSVIGSALASQIVSILQNGTYTVDGETFQVGNHPLFIGTFNISQDITLASSIHSLNGINSGKDVTMYPDAETSVLNFGNHKLTASQSFLGINNIGVKNVIMAVTGYGVLYVNAYCSSLENITTYISVVEEIYFCLKNCSFTDTAASYNDGPRYFHNCKDSTITLINKNDAVAQNTAAFDCDNCTFDLTLDKAMPDANTRVETPFIIEGLLNCHIKWTSRYTAAGYNVVYAGNTLSLTFYRKTRAYYAKNCSFIFDFRDATENFNAKVRRMLVIKPYTSISTSTNLTEEGLETITGCYVKFIGKTNVSPDDTKNPTVYMICPSGSGIINFNHNNIEIKNRFRGCIFCPGTSARTRNYKDNTVFGESHFSDDGYSLSPIGGTVSLDGTLKGAMFNFVGNSFDLKDLDSAYTPNTALVFNALKLGQIFAKDCVEAITATGTTPPSGYKPFYDSTAADTYEQGYNTINAYV